MTVRNKYILYIAIVHLVIIALTFQLLEYKILFIASEILVIISLLISISIFRDFYAPICMLLSGTDAIKDKDFNVKFVKKGKKELDQLIDVYNKMIDQLREERTFQQEQHYFLDKLIQASPVGIMLLDLDGKVAHINPKLLELLALQKDDLMGETLSDFKTILIQKIQAIPKGKSENITLEGFRTFRCQKSQFMSRGFPHTFILLEELTVERLQIEKQAYGKVIRMMAHEVNNTIGPVNSILDSVEKFLASSELANQSYSNALQVAQGRNDRLNQFMRNFADVVRLPHPTIQQENMSKTVQDVFLLMKDQAVKQLIDFKLELPSEDSYWLIDQQQIEQALVNIIKNAFEATQENGAVHIVLSHKKLIVKNTGKPIPKELEEQIFSPFFSNKTQGQGIGLTITKEVLLSHKFTFSLTSKADGWTEFEVCK